MGARTVSLLRKDAIEPHVALLKDGLKARGAVGYAREALPLNGRVGELEVGRVGGLVTVKQEHVLVTDLDG